MNRVTQTSTLINLKVNLGLLSANGLKFLGLDPKAPNSLIITGSTRNVFNDVPLSYTLRLITHGNQNKSLVVNSRLNLCDNTTDG